jgi:hypothetical protein
MLEAEAKRQEVLALQLRRQQLAEELDQRIKSLRGIDKCPKA